MSVTEMATRLHMSKSTVSRAVVRGDKIASDSELREKLGRNARRDMISDYTWEKNAQRVITAYKSILA